MPWVHGPLTVYHGTDNISANAIRTSGVNPLKFRSSTDFGAGYYVTSVLHQACQWANQRCRRSHSTNAEVLQYDISRNMMAVLSILSFVVESADFYDFVDYCRTGGTNHGPGRTLPYDVVHGPVALKGQRPVIANCDQLSFTSSKALANFACPSAPIRPPAGQKYF